MSEPVGIVKQLIDLAQTPEQVKFLMSSDTTQLSVRLEELRKAFDKLSADKKMQDAAHKSNVKTYEKVIAVMLQTALKRESYYD
jgi:hypothetical protein